MTLEIKELASADMSQLCDKLAANEDEQQKIYKIYQRAAEMDENMRQLKKEEKLIRIYMQSKIYR